jgi:hypothetical protein
MAKEPVVNSPQIYILERSQRSRGSGAHQFGGPDRYVMVVAVPPGATLPRALNTKVLKRRGITYWWCGEGYSHHTGPRSMLFKARARALQLAEGLRGSIVSQA